MSEQIVDLRSTWAILRRHGRVLVVAAAVGALAGGAVAYFLPGDYSSTSVVLFPPSPPDSAAHDIETQVQIALSDVVLGQAAESVRPRLSAETVAERVEILTPTTDVLRITAKGVSPAQAEALAGAIASADVSYLRDAANELSQYQRAALADRAATLKQSLAGVTSELKKTSDRLRTERPKSAAAKADAAALAALTAQQADIVLQLDQIKNETIASSQPQSGQPGGGASVIQPASPAVRMPVVARVALYAGLGAAVALLVTGIVVALRGRRESTLRSRDEFADAIGVPVVASLHSRAPRSVSGWTSLLQSYAPDSVEIWALRQLLRLVTPGAPGSMPGVSENAPGPTTVVVMTMSDDLPALAVGPQFASFAASTGAAIQLVRAQQPHESTNALAAACSRLKKDAQPRPGLSVGSSVDVRYTGDLIVRLAVLSRQRPDIHLDGADDAVILLAVTPGAATADDLARVAIAADDAGHPITGIVVANPDSLDRTTGRLLPTERAHHVPLPSLMTGTTIAVATSARTKPGGPR